MIGLRILVRLYRLASLYTQLNKKSHLIIEFIDFPDFQKERDTTVFSTRTPSPLNANPTAHEYLKTYAPRVLEIPYNTCDQI